MNENRNYVITFSESILLQIKKKRKKKEKKKVVQRRALLLGHGPKHDTHPERLPVNCCAISTAVMLRRNEQTNKQTNKQTSVLISFLKHLYSRKKKKVCMYLL